MPTDALSGERPFPGLRPFSYEDRAYFFGREEQTYALYNLLELSQFVAVVGSSGSGKSSLVRAGLLPLLESENEEILARDDEADRRVWRWIELRPGEGPISRLADLLTELGAPPDGEENPVKRATRRERLDYSLHRGSFGLSEALAEVEGLAGCSLLILVDQFEELFRYGGSGAARVRQQEERDQFVQLLLEAANGRDVDVHVLITMRSDFIGDCAQYYGLPEAVSACQFLVPSLTREQREAVILRPLDEDRADAAIEPALVERLLNDAGGDFDQLPVLQHCLSRLWEVAGPSSPAAPHRQMRLEHYAETGGIAEALSRHADEILRSLDGHEVAVEQVFRALSEVDGEGRATRRALSYAQLRAETGIDDSELRLAVDRFRSDDCSFLVPPISSVPVLEDETTVDIGHEALLRRWKKVAAEASETIEGESVPGWLEAEARDASIYHAMVTLAGSGSAAATLPYDQVDERWAWWTERPRTAEWADRYGGRIERVERLFANSRAAKRRRARIRSAMVAVIAILVVGGLTAWGLAYRDTKLQAEIAREERGVLLNEMTEITKVVSTQLRFIPGTNDAIVQMLTQVEGFSTDFTNLLKKHYPHGITKREQRVEARLRLTAAILRADYWVNFGHTGDAIDKLNQADQEIKELLGQDDRYEQLELQLIQADIWSHRANAETLYQATTAALANYEYAERLLSKLAATQPADAAAGGEGQTAADYQEMAKQRLAELYRNRLFLDFQYRNDLPAAADDFATFAKLVTDEADKHRPGLPDQASAYWAAQQKQRDRWEADLWVAQGRLDEAIERYRQYLRDQASATVMAEIGDAYMKFKLSLALIKRGRDGDLPEAIGHLERSDKVFSRMVERDPKNSWWSLVCAQIERTLGQAYRAQHDGDAAVAAYRLAIGRDVLLAEIDPDNPRVKDDLTHDRAAAAAQGE